MADVIRSGASIGISGARQVTNALREFEPELDKQLTKDIKHALKYVERDALFLYPGAKYSIGRTKKKMLGYIAASRGGYRADSWAQSGGGVRAGIFEFIGSRYAGDRPQVKGLIASLNRRTGRDGSRGRILWQAWELSKSVVAEDIKHALQTAEHELQRRLDAAGEL